MGKILSLLGHPEPGLWHRCAKAQEENTEFLLHFSQGQLHRLWEKAKQDAGMASSPRGACGICSFHRNLSRGTQPSQGLQGQNRTSALPRTKVVRKPGKSSLGDEELLPGKSTCPCPSPALGQRWQLQGGVTSSIPPIWQGDTKPLSPQTPILSIQERFFPSPGISNQPMCAGNRASHRLAKEK